MKISPKALGLLFHMCLHGSEKGSKGLQEAFGVGKEYVYSGLTELRSNGLIEAITGRTSSGRFWKKIKITEKGRSYVKRYKYHGGKPATEPRRKTRTYIRQNSYIANTTYSIYTNSVNQGNELRSFQEKEKEEMVGTMDHLGSTPIDKDDIEHEKKKDKKKKIEQKKEYKRLAFAERQSRRASRPIEDWSTSDVVNYFAEMVKTIWRLPEVERVERPKFVAMLDNFRAIHDTDGLIEKELLDRWFSRNRNNTELVDADRFFSQFLYYAPSMLQEVKRSIAPEETNLAETMRAKRRSQLGLE